MCDSQHQALHRCATDSDRLHTDRPSRDWAALTLTINRVVCHRNSSVTLVMFSEHPTDTRPNLATMFCGFHIGWGAVVFSMGWHQKFHHWVQCYILTPTSIKRPRVTKVKTPLDPFHRDRLNCEPEITLCTRQSPWLDTMTSFIPPSTPHVFFSGYVRRTIAIWQKHCACTQVKTNEQERHHRPSWIELSQIGSRPPPELSCAVAGRWDGRPLHPLPPPAQVPPRAQTLHPAWLWVSWTEGPLCPAPSSCHRWSHCVTEWTRKQNQRVSADAGDGTCRHSTLTLQFRQLLYVGLIDKRNDCELTEVKWVWMLLERGHQSFVTGTFSETSDADSALSSLLDRWVTLSSVCLRGVHHFWVWLHVVHRHYVRHSTLFVEIGQRSTEHEHSTCSQTQKWCKPRRTSDLFVFGQTAKRGRQVGREGVREAGRLAGS